MLLFNNATVPATGAMENWGLVTYRETALLIDPAHSSSAAKQWVALVVGHELAHQWFGNLVTMVNVQQNRTTSLMLKSLSKLARKITIVLCDENCSQ